MWGVAQRAQNASMLGPGAELSDGLNGGEKDYAHGR